MDEKQILERIEQIVVESYQEQLKRDLTPEERGRIERRIAAHVEAWKERPNTGQNSEEHQEWLEKSKGFDSLIVGAQLKSIDWKKREKELGIPLETLFAIQEEGFNDVKLDKRMKSDPAIRGKKNAGKSRKLEAAVILGKKLKGYSLVDLEERFITHAVEDRIQTKNGDTWEIDYHEDKEKILFENTTNGEKEYRAISSFHRRYVPGKKR